MKNPCRLCPLTLFLLIFTCSKSTVETLEKDRSSVFIVNIEHISHFFLLFLLLTLNKKILAGQRHLFQLNYFFQSTLELPFPYQNITFQFTQILYRRQPSHSIGLIGREFPFVYFFTLVYVSSETVTAKYTVISPNFQMQKLYLSTKFPHEELGEIKVFFAVNCSKYMP